MTIEAETPEPELGPDLTAEPDERASRLKKAPTAFRTISEVADELHVPQHVLRFWETRFPQVKPLKRGGGRRYYRPDDVGLLRRIADLLYIQGYTIKGVQRLLLEGDGTLQGDLPPPDLAEGDAEAIGAPASFARAAETGGRPAATAKTYDADPSPAPAAASPSAMVEPAADAGRGSHQAAMLRDLLGEMLQALEAIRDRLKPG